MKKLILNLLLMISLFGVQQGMAQSSDVSDKVKELTEKQIEELSLTDDQIPQVKALNEEMEIELQKIKESDDSRRTKFKAIKKIEKTRTESMESILSDDQFDIFKTTKKENRKKMKEELKG